MLKHSFRRILALLLPVLCLTVFASAAELPQLSTPTDLVWGVDRHLYESGPETDEYVSNEIPGMISWQWSEPFQNQYSIAIYRVGSSDPVSSVSVDMGSRDLYSPYVNDEFFLEGRWLSELDSPTDDPNFPSGTYYFTVQALGDGTQYRDSAIVTSSNWTYTAPDQLLPTPTGLKWDGRYALWNPVGESDPAYDYVYGFVTEFYWEDPDTGDLIPVGGSMSGSYGGSACEDYIYDDCFQEYGLGDYYFRVRLMSNDTTVYAGSKWSELSPAYKLTEFTDETVSTLEQIYGEVSDWGVDETTGLLYESDAGDMKDWMWNSLSDTDAMESVMLADTDDTGVNSYLAELENLVGGPAEVQVSQNGTHEDLDVEKISILGANLNTEGLGKTTLTVGKADEGTVIPELYENTVQFSMKLEGVETDETTGSQELKIPVKITMPVPAGINPDFLVVMHFHANGDYEEIWPHVYADDTGKYWASFVVTSFSDFALGEVPDIAVLQGYEDSILYAAVANRQAASCIAVVYDSYGKVIDVDFTSLKADIHDVQFELHRLPDGQTVSIFLLDSNGVPIIAPASESVANVLEGLD